MHPTGDTVGDDNDATLTGVGDEIAASTLIV